MPPVTGHVFVVPGNLQSLQVDDVLISTDYGGRVGKTWWPVFGWDEREGEIRSRSLPQLSPKQRVALVPRTSSEGPNRWLVAVGAYEGASVKWLTDGVREALDAVTKEGRKAASLGRPRRVAMPVMGVGRGGYDGQRGKVIHGLLEVTQAAAKEHGLD